MGTINHRTSDYITMANRPEYFSDYTENPGVFEEMQQLAREWGISVEQVINDEIANNENCDRENVEYLLKKHKFYYFRVEIVPGYYAGFSLQIEHNFPLVYDSHADKIAAQNEITEIKQFLLDCAGCGIVACSPGWCTKYYNYNETKKQIAAAVQKMRDDVRRVPTWATVQRLREKLNSM